MVITAGWLSEAETLRIVTLYGGNKICPSSTFRQIDGTFKDKQIVGPAKARKTDDCKFQRGYGDTFLSRDGWTKKLIIASMLFAFAPICRFVDIHHRESCRWTWGLVSCYTNDQVAVVSGLPSLIIREGVIWRAPGQQTKRLWLEYFGLYREAIKRFVAVIWRWWQMPMILHFLYSIHSNLSIE